ncbi:hypothetical protein COM33_00155 [Bacillus toyonensis]|uniref:hypothetical protein n=1 Tax=Bacillus TaxID=1386 RepID=UPI0001A08A31|nr:MULTISPECIES: hypothetical protein [Bacillus]EEL24153.1 hypothetical protein bcere0017_9570 [Bacillus cereus Rock1-3]KNH42696.1 hypothetical protein ACS75_00890 [Bacillus thuringiensis]KXY20470.1 hypothetical protein AT259_13495 [Bacillus cereus]MDH8703849.1 hypothetical protein [Stenotrophomonas sp. 1198]AHA09635.1 hypothetical protein Btoyo_3763 [Bacillus toyonensis BCT-7112]
MLSKKQIGYIFVLVGFFTIIITTLFFQDYEYVKYVKYVKGAGLMCWFVSAFLIPNYEPRKVSKNR